MEYTIVGDVNLSADEGRMLGEYLDEDVMRLVSLYYLHGYSQSEVADMMKVSQSTISRRLDKVKMDLAWLNYEV